jgi:hypothetical protein
MLNTHHELFQAFFVIWVGTAYRKDVSERVCAKTSFYKTKMYYESARLEKKLLFHTLSLPRVFITFLGVE